MINTTYLHDYTINKRFTMWIYVSWCITCRDVLESIVFDAK